MGTVNFFEAIRKTDRVKARIISLAINVTKIKKGLGVIRKMNQWVGDDPYSASKGCSESMTNAYLKSFFSNDSKCKIASARAGNVIGGGDWAENRIVPDFFRSLENNDNFVIRNPNSTRPWQYVLEPLSGYLWLATKIFDEGEKFTGGWNFGPLDNLHAVLELINSIKKGIGRNKSISIENEKKYHEASLLKLDISKVLKFLDWAPTLDYEETIKFTVNGYLAEMESAEIYNSRVKQISDYIKVAQTKKNTWSNG